MEPEHERTDPRIKLAAKAVKLGEKLESAVTHKEALKWLGTGVVLLAVFVNWLQHDVEGRVDVKTSVLAKEVQETKDGQKALATGFRDDFRRVEDRMTTDSQRLRTEFLEGQATTNRKLDRLLDVMLPQALPAPPPPTIRRGK